jgi:hypothetical protein
MLIADRARYKAMMMANPTATSAAATVRAKKTKTCPAMSWKYCENATKLIFVAFNISSIDDDDVPAKEDPDESGQEHDAAENEIIA